MKTKSELRARRLEARRRLTAAEVAGKSRAIVQRLDGLAVMKTASTVLCYVSSKDNEVDTCGLITSLLARERRVLVPIAEAGGLLLWSHLDGLGDLDRGRFGILEPRPGCRRVVSPPGDALVIVPGVAFTPEGGRIGYGGGYYDRFLARHGGTSIGLAYACQIIDGFAMDDHDVPVDFVLTEEGVYGDLG